MRIPFIAVFIFVLDLVQAKDSIVGGEPTTIEVHPYQLSLQSYGKAICGATIIGANIALTSAHCTDGIFASALSVRAGSSLRGSGGKVIQVYKINQHPKYNPRTLDYDVSVLSLAERIPFGDSTSPIALQGRGLGVNDGEPGIITGWGTLSSGGPSSSQLQEATVNKINEQTCNEAYGSITSRMICYGAPGKDACQGDAGGPVVTNGVQTGIISWGRGCSMPGYPGVYTRISDPEIYDHILLSTG